MHRFVWILFTATTVLLSTAGQAWAQDYPLNSGWNGPGFYLNWIKVLAYWLVFLGWVFTTDWLNEDAQEMKQDYQRWNPIVFGVFIGAFVLVWAVIPFFWLGLAILLAAHIAPLTVYIVKRNHRVAVNDRVLTPSHLRAWFAGKASLVGIKMEAEAKDPHEAGPPVILTSRGGATERDNNIRLLSARQAPGFREIRQIVADGMDQRADAIMLDFAQQAVAVRYLVDGVWLDGQPRDRETSDPALEALKILCGMNSQDRQSRQEGLFATQYRADKMLAKAACQGTPTGERVLIEVERKKTKFNTLDELGMRPKMQEQLQQTLAQASGFVLISAMPATGLRSTTHVLIRSLDRFMREFVAVEDESNRYDPIENVPVTVYKPEEKHHLEELFDNLFHHEPNAVVVRDLVDAKMVSLLFEQLAENRMFISTIRAKECVDALLRMAALKVPLPDLAKYVTAVLNQRLIRKLCEHCKEAYAPTPEVLRQLQIPEGKVQAFYRPPTPNPEQPKEICTYCNGVGYLGRTALFELLVLDDAFRNVLAVPAKPEVLRQAARKAGMRTLQEEGIILVAKGVTSVPELVRVLKL